MRLALLSDVHGNTPALRAVLADAAARSVDLIVNLGDIASGGVDPAGTVATLRTSTMPTVHVRGNHERQLLTQPVARMGSSDLLAHDRLSAEDKAWLAQLSPIAVVAGVLAFHATPELDLQYLLHTVTPMGLRVATDAEISTRLGTHADHHQVFACGHTHLQGQRRLPGGSLVINPGSVGWPAYTDDHPHPHVVEAGSPHARYTVLERGSASDEWRVTPIALDYDIDDAAALATANGRPDVAHALRFGRVLIGEATTANQSEKNTHP